MPIHKFSAGHIITNEDDDFCAVLVTLPEATIVEIYPSLQEYVRLSGLIQVHVFEETEPAIEWATRQLKELSLKGASNE